MGCVENQNVHFEQQIPKRLLAAQCKELVQIEEHFSRRFDHPGPQVKETVALLVMNQKTKGENRVKQSHSEQGDPGNVGVASRNRRQSAETN